MTGTRSTIHLLLCCCMLVVSAYAPTSPSASASAGSACSACLQDGVKEALRVAWTTAETGQKASNIFLRWHSFRCRHHDCMFNNTSSHPSSSRNFHRAYMCAFSLHIFACLSRAQHTHTAIRGFLLGFGGAILKDLLVDRKATVSEEKTDFANTFRFARVVGLGAACFLVGVAVALPSNLRYQFLTRQ